MATKAALRKPDQLSGNPDDLIRDAILRHLFAIHRAAKSPSKAAIGIRDLHSALKAEHGFKQQEVGSNLDYLVQKVSVGAQNQPPIGG